MNKLFLESIETQLIIVFLSLFLLVLTGGFVLITGFIMVKRCTFTAQKKPQTSRHEGNITISYGNEIDLENTLHHQTIIDDLEFFEIRSDIESIDFSYEDAKKKANITIRSQVPEIIHTINEREYLTMPNRKTCQTKAKRNLLREFNANSGQNFNNRYAPKRVFSASFFENL